MQQLTETDQVLQTSVSSMAKLIQDLITKQNKEATTTLNKELGNNATSAAAATVVSNTAGGAVVASSSSNTVNNVATLMKEIVEG